jgi:hypothetical protein
VEKVMLAAILRISLKSGKWGHLSPSRTVWGVTAEDLDKFLPDSDSPSVLANAKADTPAAEDDP